MSAADLLAQQLQVSQDMWRGAEDRVLRLNREIDSLEEGICSLQTEYHALQRWIVERHGQAELDAFLNVAP